MAASNDDWGGGSGWDYGASTDNPNVDWDGTGGASTADDAQFGAGQDSYGQGEQGFGDGDAGGAFNDACFGCGETGHRKADCPNPQARGPITCNQCGQEGHIRADCTAPRHINREKVAILSIEDAWDKLIKAAAERDVDDAKDGIQEYVKASNGEPTYRQIQEGFINNKIELWLIALERPLSGAFTNMDLQGNIGKKYTVSVRFSKKPARPREREGWPENTEEILARLDDAGDTVDSGKMRCHNCDEYGHGSKNCPEPPREREEHKVTCNNCDGEHRTRDCPEPRVDRNACKNCGESGHRANECPEPPNPANMTCRKCEETGHMARDCPQGGGRACHNCGEEGHMSKECPNPKAIKCRNCDEMGHTGRECPKPKDWSRVQCSNCQQFGHTKVRCKEPTAEDPADDAGGFGAGDQAGDTGGDGWNSNDVPVTTANDDGW